MVGSRRAVVPTMSIVLAVLLPGCAALGGDHLPPVRSFPGPQLRKPSASVEVTLHQSINGKPVSFAREMGAEALAKKCIKRFQRSGLFGEVAESLSDPDLRVSIDFTDRGEGSFGRAVLTGLTFFLVPSSATDNYELDAVVLDTASGRQWTIRLEDRVTQYQQIFLLPLMPFKGTVFVAARVQKNMFDNLALRMCEEGCFW